MDTVELPNVTQQQAWDWWQGLLFAESRYLSALKGHAVGEEARAAATDTFEAALERQASAHWEEIVSHIWRAMADDFGLASDAPITFVVNGLLDGLPLHVACRTESGRLRYAIEDRVIRYAPNFLALKFMAERAAARCATKFVNASENLTSLVRLHLMPVSGRVASGLAAATHHPVHSD